VAAHNDSDPTLEGSLMLTGYLLDCTAAPCAKTAQ